jgi:formylmethanofuran dehydrogenase subunit C
MSTLTLTLKHPPTLRLDLRGITPKALAALSVAEIEHLPLLHGAHTTPLGEWFGVTSTRGDALELRLVGDCRCVDRIGWGLTQGHVRVEGDAGDYAGALMTGGALHVQGSAGVLAACEMAGGTLTVAGDVGDFAASTQPGSMDGMRGGTLVVQGRAGARLADRMRRGTVIVQGAVGEFAASRLVAGTVVLCGPVGAHLAYGMRRGSVVLATPQAGTSAAVPATFVPAGAEAPVFWQLLSRDLIRFASTVPALPHDLPRRAIRRHLGDLAVDGKGELITVL